MINFPIRNKSHEFELGYGVYHIYFLGGFSLENLDLLDIRLFSTKTGETITLKEKSLKFRDRINGQKAICCFTFQINQAEVLKIEISNSEILVVKKSYSHPFSLFQFFPNPVVNPEYVHVAITS